MQPAASRLFIDSTRRDMYPTFSSDGRQIAFQSMRSGWPEIWIADSDGSHQRQITNLRPMSTGPARWSPDGTKLAFHVEMETYARLFLLDLATGRARRLNLPPVIDRMPSWSHDGKWIYFVRRGEAPQIWKVAAEGGVPVQLTKKSGLDPLESFDGRFVFYSKLTGGVWRIPVSGGEEEQVVPDTVSNLGLAYAAARTGIYFVTMPGQSRKETLKYFNFATGQTTSVAELGYTHLALAVSPDEQTVLYSALDHRDSDLMLVENFR
jgi:Tol biopolymer transport system component